jgi:flagellar motility protein MotE (MotC chaperone)
MGNVEQEQGYGKLEWFFYIIILPLLFTSILTGILLSFLGYDLLSSVHRMANEIPLLEKIIPDPQVQEGINGLGIQGSTAAQVTQLQAQIQQQDAALTKLKADMEVKNAEIEKLAAENATLKEENQKETLSKEEHLNKLQQLSSMYGSMSPGKAAPIIENLVLEEAVLVLSEMKLEPRSKILEKMDPKKAADISILLKDVVPTTDREVAALQERVSLLTKALSEQQKKGLTDKDLAVAYASMPPDAAGKVLADLYTNSPSKAILILASMDRQAMSLIMSQMPTETASAITSKMLDQS